MPIHELRSWFDVMPRNVTLVRFDPANARESIYEVLFIDSGSVTERMPVHWANA